MVAGFFILFEDLVLVGDFVEIGGIKGVVQEIGVRITKIRDEFGVLHSIPNGEVRKVANHSREYVNAVIDVHVPYEEDPRRVRALLAQWTEKALEEEGAKRGPVGVDVEELTEASILMRIIAAVPPGRDKELSDLVRARVIEELRASKVGAPRFRRAVIVDSTLRAGSPPDRNVEEEAEGPPNPFKPEAAGD
ncbi:MAG: mechanosensitive ion channel family protein [Polyangiaceae bacterium]|nr:mechanosensitive ion channel family protein [Polyangiaceae bacterium]